MKIFNNMEINNNSIEDLKNSRRHKGVEALSLALLLAISFTAGLHLRSKVCDPNANSINIGCLGINGYLVFHAFLLGEPIKKGLESIFPKQIVE